MSAQGPEDHARLAEDFPSPSAAMHMDMAAELERQAAAEETGEAMDASDVLDQTHDLEHQVHHAHHEQQQRQHEEHHPSPATLQSATTRSRTLKVDSFYTPDRHPPNTSHMSTSRQLEVMREFFGKNPNPTRAELDMLAEKTGRPWRKVREYFRQRRNKGRGATDLDHLAEPARATGWLQSVYRADPSSSQSQLSLYSAYKTRFDPYQQQAPLLGGQELIQLAIATFPGCEMARDEGEYVLRGVDKREGGREAASGDAAEGSRGIDGVVEPIRASTWLLNNFQHASPTSATPSLTQTDLYTAYATRFSFTPPPSGPSPSASTSQLPTEMALGTLDDLPNVDELDEEQPGPSGPTHQVRLLDPVELITLTRMTFPDSEPVVDEAGRFVIRGIARREGARLEETTEMFPFASMNAPHPSSPSHPLTSLLKRKLAQLHPDSDDPDSDPDTASRKRQNQAASQSLGPDGDDEEITAEDRKLIEGLKRFRGSKLGSEVRDVCVSQ